MKIQTPIQILPETTLAATSPPTDWQLQYTGLVFILVSGLVFLLPEWGLATS